MLAFAKGADTAEEIDAVVAGDVPLCPRGCGGADVERLGQMGKVGGGDPAYKCVRCGCEYLVTVGPRGRGRRTVFLNEPYTFESGQWEPGLLAGTPVKEIKRMDTDVKGPVAGKLIKACQVEGVSPEEDGEGWVVGFEDGSMALVSYEVEEGDEIDPGRRDRELEVCGWPRDTKLVSGQGRNAIKAVRAYLGAQPMVQQVSVGVSGSREWQVLFPNGLRVRVSQPGGEGDVFASQDDIEEWDFSGGLDDDETLKWSKRARRAVEAWLVKHKSSKWALDEWEDHDRFKKEEEARQAKEAAMLAEWYRFDLEGSGFGKEGLVVSREGVELEAGRDYAIRYVDGGYRIYLSPNYVRTQPGTWVCLARNAQALHKFKVPLVPELAADPGVLCCSMTPLEEYEAKHGPQVSGVFQDGGGYSGADAFEDWHVKFHQGTMVWVREHQCRNGFELRCPTQGRPVGGGASNEGVDVLSKYAEVAERVVKAEIDWIAENVTFTKRGLGFEVQLSFGKTGRCYEWAWSRPTLPPVEGEVEQWCGLTEHDPEDKSGWCDRALLILLRELRAEYRVEDADREPGGPGNDVIAWTDLGPVRCHIHPDKDADGHAYALVDVGEVPGEVEGDHQVVRDRIERFVQSYLAQPDDPVKMAGLESRLKDMTAQIAEMQPEGDPRHPRAVVETLHQVAMDDHERGVQIEAAAAGEGHYPVHRAADEPGEDPEVLQRYGVATEEGMIFVKAKWAKIGDENRVVAYDVETRCEGMVPSHNFRERVIDSLQAFLKASALKLLEPDVGEMRCPHDGGKCHHECKPGECYREEGGMSLTTPHDGYPLLPDGWTLFGLDGANVGVPDDYHVYLGESLMAPGRKKDYVFIRREGSWFLAVDPATLNTKSTATLRICHFQGDSEREVWNCPWKRHHTEHCAKRMKWGDGECECGGRVGIAPAEPNLDDPEWDDLKAEAKLDHVTTMAYSCIVETGEKTKPTLEGLETRIHNMEIAIAELMDEDEEEPEDEEDEDAEDEEEDFSASYLDVKRLTERMDRLDAETRHSLARLSDESTKVQQALKGVAAHEQWLQGLEHRFAVAALPDPSKAAQALLKTVLATVQELESRSDAAKDLGSALAKKVGEMGHQVHDTHSSSIRLDRMMVDLTWQVSKLIEIVIGADGQLADVVEDPDCCDLVTRIAGIDERLEDLYLGRKAEAVMADENDPVVPFDPERDILHDEPRACRQILDQRCPTGSKVGFAGNTTMKGVVTGQRKREGHPERLVRWDDMGEENKTAGGWHSVDDLYELAEEPVYPGASRASKIASNGPEFPGYAFEVPFPGRYMVEGKTVDLEAGTYSLITGSAQPPKAKVPCGVGVVMIKDLAGGNLVLLGKRKGSHGEGQWAVPGGRIEPGEDPRACAARELEEETGICIHPSRLMVWEHCPFNSTVTGGEPWVTLFYWVQVSDEEGQPKLMEPDKCSEWDFFSTQNLPEPLFEASAEMARRTGWVIKSEIDHCSDD
jgi:8-oxo-dGTP diphosphatase